jgi:hypothetical protein
MGADTTHAAVIWRRNGKFYGHIRELGILEHGASAAEVWSKLEQRKQEMRARFEEADIVQLFPAAGTVEAVAVDHRTRRFLIKTAAVAAALLVCIYAAGVQMHSATTLFVRQIGREFSANNLIWDWVARVEAMPEAKRAEDVQRVRRLVNALRPYAAEFKRLFDSLEQAGGSPSR